jgi:hypothetical protein
MSLLKSNIFMGLFSAGTLMLPIVEFHTLTLAHGYNFIPVPLPVGRILYLTLTLTQQGRIPAHTLVCG